MENISVIEQLCTGHNNAFLIGGDIMKPTNIIEHKIELIENSKSICTIQYRLPESHKKEVQRQVDDLKNRGIIEISQSEWNSPVMLIGKKSDIPNKKQYRIPFYGYRKVNAVIKKPSFPAPIIEDILDSLANTKYCTRLDVRQAYHQVPLSNESKQYTSFSVAHNKFKFTRSPFGLAISGHVWCETIARTLEKLIGKNMLIYIDDIIKHRRYRNER